MAEAELAFYHERLVGLLSSAHKREGPWLRAEVEADVRELGELRRELADVQRERVEWLLARYQASFGAILT